MVSILKVQKDFVVLGNQSIFSVLGRRRKQRLLFIGNNFHAAGENGYGILGQNKGSNDGNKVEDNVLFLVRFPEPVWMGCGELLA
jgi:hypothetical protein